MTLEVSRETTKQKVEPQPPGDGAGSGAGGSTGNGGNAAGGGGSSGGRVGVVLLMVALVQLLTHHLYNMVVDVVDLGCLAG